MLSEEAAQPDNKNDANNVEQTTFLYIVTPKRYI
jgi:hypothetical protein